MSTQDRSTHAGVTQRACRAGFEGALLALVSYSTPWSSELFRTIWPLSVATVSTEVSSLPEPALTGYVGVTGHARADGSPSRPLSSTASATSREMTSVGGGMA